MANCHCPPPLQSSGQLSLPIFVDKVSIAHCDCPLSCSSPVMPNATLHCTLPTDGCPVAHCSLPLSISNALCKYISLPTIAHYLCPLPIAHCLALCFLPSNCHLSPIANWGLPIADCPWHSPVQLPLAKYYCPRFSSGREALVYGL